MKPVRTNRSNAVYRGPTVDILDAWVERAQVPTADGSVGVVYIDWQLEDGERDRIAAGALVRLGIWGMEPIPPVSLEARPDLAVIDAEPPEIVEERP